MRTFYLALAAVGVASGVGVLGCRSLVCEDDNTCVGASGMDGGGDGSVIDGGGMDGTADTAPPGCDASADPKDSPACVDDTLGVFVSPTGSDATGAGTKALPVATIAHAVSLTTSAKSRVYVCEGAYPAAISLDATHDGVSLYGGFDCVSWAFASKSVKIAPAASAAAPPALRITGFSKAASFEDLEVDAPNGTAPGDSSVAALVTGSSGITFKRVILAAGTGVTGTNGAAGAVGAPTPADLSGITGGLAGSNADKTCTCSNGGTTTGGLGAAGVGGNGNDGKVAQAVPSPATATGHGGVGTDCFASSGTYVTGRNGSDAPVGGDASKLTTSGKLDATGWHPANGTTGVSGLPGQGGGGGGGVAASQGGGGACGGCGASGGTGGAGGGASIALAVMSSSVTINASTLSTKKAGDGGGGMGGGTGQTGGTKGTQSGGACSGGNGGTGGNGGAGSGGSGGIAVGVLYSGTKPTVDPGTTAAITLGGAGAAGAGGKTPALDGKPGLAAPVQDATLL